MPLKPLIAVLCYDPRDPAQDPDDHTTWTHSNNGILIAATMLHTSRDNQHMSWDKVAALADVSEEPEPSTGSIGAHAATTLAETNSLLRSVLSRRPTGFA